MLGILFTLNYLFLGGRTPPCLDGADVNDDGLINLTDPIALLGHLFQAGRPPALPFPEPGLDPTPDRFFCGPRP